MRGAKLPFKEIHLCRKVKGLDGEGDRPSIQGVRVLLAGTTVPWSVSWDLVLD